MDLKILSSRTSSESSLSIENYEVFERIGEGAYAEVYRGWDKEKRRIVAMKRLKMEQGHSLSKIILREVKAVQKVQHKNVVTFREFIEDGRNTFLIMDYAPTDLRVLIKDKILQNQKFAPEEVNDFVLQLSRGVKHLHEKSIFHRDLKPSNILITNLGVLKICDFGMAREFEPTRKIYTPYVVTRWYRAPEVLLSYGQYGAAIDIWSVGCIFAELNVLKVLFPGNSEIQQIYKILEVLGTPTEEIRPGYNELPIVRKTNFVNFPKSNLRETFGTLSDLGFDLIMKMITYDPIRRITAEQAVEHPYFKELALTTAPPTVPARRRDDGMKMTTKRKYEDIQSQSCEQRSNIRAVKRQKRFRL